MFIDKAMELEKRLAEKEKEAGYYKSIAKKASDGRLRETEELSKLAAALKEKIHIIDNQRKELEELYKENKKNSITDELTGLLNRRGLMLQAKQVFQRCKRRNFADRQENGDGETFVCALLDIDFFKKINDAYGHLTGDKFLTQLSDAVLEPGIFREIDIIGRFGGDEFMFILPKCSEKNALIPLGKLMQSIKNRVFIPESGPAINITASIGVSEYRKEDTDVYKAIDRADEALYYAKNHGKDTIILSCPATRKE